MLNGVKPEDVPFNPQQLAALEALFPEVARYESEDSKLHYIAGTRSVVAYVRSNIEKQIRKSKVLPTRNIGE